MKFASVISVTHDHEEAVALADRIILMDLGGIQQIGTIDELWDFPVNEFVAGFLGTPSMNFIDGRIEAPDKVSITINGMKAVFGFDKKLKEGHRDGDVKVGIRPDKVFFCSGEKQGKALPCVIEVIEPQGEQKILTGSCENTEIKVLEDQSREVSVGDTTWLEFNPESIHLFDKETGNSLTEPE
ncbi:MAG: ABC transporter ATP-binding protein [Desulfobacteraceae bacterium]|nr:ABC transporter ATP-binding protein [Desulfobacteraceae bacterium]